MAKRTTKKQPLPTRDLPNRSEILRRADEAVSKARNTSYGEPQDDLASTSEHWDSYSTRITQVRGLPLLRPMILLKISRLAHSPGEMDHWVDIAGYAAIGAEIAGEEEIGNCCD